MTGRDPDPPAAGTPGLSPVAEQSRVLFVGGLGRSGSTLLELLLGQDRRVCALGEVVHLWQRGLHGDERCGCGHPFRECGFWEAVGRRAFGGWSRVDLTEIRELRLAVDRTRHLPRLARRPPERLREQLRRYTAYYSRIYRAALAVSGADVVVDSSKHASLAFALRWADDVDLRVLHLVRDVRGVAHSWGKAVRRPEVIGRDEFMPRWSPLTVSALWMVQNAAFELLGGARPRARLRYEDLTLDPVGALARVRELAGLPATQAGLAAVLDGDVPLRASHSVAGNPLRFHAGPVRVRRDDEWRSALPARHRVLVSALTLPLALRYGYLIGRRR